ncbi:aminotransferase class IV [Marinomonas sp.]|nr:aminotransferase class IV [Marinomonas sp.]MDB4837042.1 aminotransferase class IV [Marinomonas sp.]
MQYHHNFPAFYNGKYLNINEISISPLDRGFLFGDSIYEAIPVYAGKTLDEEGHVERLMEGLHSVGIISPYSSSVWRSLLEPLLDSQAVAQLIYIQVSRGNETSRKHRFPVACEPNVLMFSNSFIPPIDLNYQGCAGHLQEDFRWQRCDIKSTSLMGNVLAYQKLYQDGVANDEALLVRDGKVVEAPSSNIFAYKNGVIYTPPLGNILGGITRSINIKLAKDAGLKIVEEAPSCEFIKTAQEVWVTNSMEELKPVVSIDGEMIGDGLPGPIWKELFHAFQGLKA